MGHFIYTDHLIQAKKSKNNKKKSKTKKNNCTTFRKHKQGSFMFRIFYKHISGDKRA